MDEVFSNWMEVGERAYWSVTSAKQGNGVELMRDNNTATYWQSEGHQPHLIDILFPTETQVLEMLLYFDFKQDESYTPSRISVYGGASDDDLKLLMEKEFHEPKGWQHLRFYLLDKHDAADPFDLWVNHLQVAITGNHQNGRDSHVRQIKIYGPKKQDIDPYVKQSSPNSVNDTTPNCSPPEAVNLPPKRRQRGGISNLRY